MARRKYTRKKPYVLTPARRAAILKAGKISARKRKGRTKKRRRYSSDPFKRGVGVKGLRKNTVPYARVNKRSQTAGFNTGTIPLPYVKKRIAIGGYIRIENTGRKGAVDKALAKAGGIAAPRGTKRGNAKEFFVRNVDFKGPAFRADVGTGQVRLGTSRSGGPTVIVRRGRHPTTRAKSRSGVRRYDRRMATIAGQRARKRRKRARPQRRRRR